METQNEILLAAVNNLLKKESLGQVTTILSKVHAADAAEILEGLSDEERKRVFEAWDVPHSADTLLEMGEEEQIGITETLSATLLAEILQEMAPDDAVDILHDVPGVTAADILDVMEPGTAGRLRRLLQYGKDTAGGLMNPEFVALRKDMTTEQAIMTLRSAAPEAENIYYLFVINREHQLVGVVSLRDLIIAAPDVQIRDIANRAVVSVETGADQEEVARIMAKYDLLALPVVDAEQYLLGVVTIDDVVDVIEEEATEDMYRLAGTTEEEETGPAGGRLARAFKARLPWLTAALIGEVIIVGGIADHYRDLFINYLPTLTIYWMAMTAQAGNTAVQSATVVVRGLATGDVDPRELWSRVFREARLGFMMGLVFSALLFGVAVFWQKAMILGVIVASATVVVVLAGAIVGALVPMIFQRLGLDPAVSSGPFLTMTMDAASLLLYFSIAILVLSSAGVI